MFPSLTTWVRRVMRRWLVIVELAESLVAEFGGLVTLVTRLVPFEIGLDIACPFFERLFVVSAGFDTLEIDKGLCVPFLITARGLVVASTRSFFFGAPLFPLR
ncbi:uncharacterized protein GGS25DRAFT_468558 [Hypoxylon fragiforme]|uniref:uncharacterized protein n=1 Tax=Hypoxylon fragiforme TaxID=63214 RepID=UPI0020C6D95A|nr:uncharacterized protein GGS25DRAFT_468558 [Hypoxylon fragiforme]KAI2613716.1 hypothetical protein GGS25DRAFT_468558 [Hypoxylon fragiforme]